MEEECSQLLLHLNNGCCKLKLKLDYVSSHHYVEALCRQTNDLLTIKGCGGKVNIIISEQAVMNNSFWDVNICAWSAVRVVTRFW